MTLAELQPDPSKRNTPAPPQNEVWGVPWHSDDGFNGLAYYIASLFGFEIQIDATERGSSPTDAAGNETESVLQRFRGTGAIYNEPRQALNPVSGLAPNLWHTFIIRAQGTTITVDVRVNGGPVQRRTSFTYDPTLYPAKDPRSHPLRGLPTQLGQGPDGRSGLRYIGLQSHFQSKRIKFRKIFIEPL